MGFKIYLSWDRLGMWAPSMNRRIYFQLTRSWIYQASPFTSFDGLFFFEVGCTKICPASFDNLEGPAVDHWSGDRARFSRCPIRMSRFDLLSDIEKFLLSAIVLIILKKRLRFVFVWLVFCSFLLFSQVHSTDGTNTHFERNKHSSLWSILDTCRSAKLKLTYGLEADCEPTEGRFSSYSRHKQKCISTVRRLMPNRDFWRITYDGVQGDT